MSDIRAELLKKYNIHADGGSEASADQTTAGKKDYRTQLLEKYSDTNVEKRRKTVSDWKSRYNKVLKAVSDYNTKRNGGYTKDASGGFSGEIDSLILDYEKIRDYADGNGLPNAPRYLKQLQDMQGQIQQTNSLMASFANEDDFNTAVQQGKWYEKYRGKDYAQLDEMLSALDEGEEREWLKSARYELYKSDPSFEQQAQSGWKKFQEAASPEQEKQDDHWFRDTVVKALSGAGMAGHGNAGTQAMQDATFKMLSDDPLKRPTQEWSEEENRIFGYLFEKDQDRAEAYAIERNEAKNLEKADGQREKVREWATKSKLNSAFATAGEIGAGVAGAGLADTLAQGVEMVAKGRMSQHDYITPYQAASEAAGAVSQKLNDTVGTLDENIPVVGGKGLGDLYQLGISVAESLTLARMTAGADFASAFGMGDDAAGWRKAASVLFPNATDVVFFGNSAASGIEEAKMRGATDEQAYALGALNGLNEAVGEHFSIENLIHMEDPATLAKFARNVLKQAGIEGSEEGFTTVLNNWADQLVMADKSQFWQLVDYYTSPEIGMSEKDAKKAAWLDMANDLAFDMLGGTISGMASATVESGSQKLLSKFADNETYKPIYGDSAVELVQEGLASPEGTQSRILAEQYQKKLDKGRSLTGTELRRMVEANELQIRAEDLENDGFTVTQNTERGTLEISFADKPSEDVQKALTENGFRWSKKNKVWFGSGEQEQIRQIIREAGGKTDASNDPVDSLESKFSEEDTDTPRGTGEERQEDAFFKISDTAGKTLLNLEDGSAEETSITGIASNEKGNLMLYVEGRSEPVSAKSISYANDGEAALYHTIHSMEMPPAAAQKLVERVHMAEDTTGEISFGVRQMYQLGEVGVPLSKAVTSGYAAGLSEDMREFGYYLGKRVYDAQTAKAEAAKKAVAARQRGVLKPGRKKVNGVSYDGLTAKVGKDGAAEIEGVTLNDQQRVGIRAAELLASLGMDIHIYQSQTRENGSYSLADGSISINLNSGKSGQGVMAYTIAHEFTHFMEQQSPAKFQRFTAALFEETDGDVEEWTEAKAIQLKQQFPNVYQNASQERLLTDARSEVVAEACETMLTDTDAAKRIAQNLKKKDQSLWQRVVQWFRDLGEKLRKAYEGLKPDSEIAQATSKTIQQVDGLVQMWAEMAVDAAENYRTAEAKENTTPKSGETKYSINRGFADKFDAWDRKTRFQFLIGTTSDALKSIGINEKRIFWDASKIKKIQDKHPQMTDSIIKQVPNILENPVLIMESQTIEGRLTLFGEVYDAAGVPVLAVLELDPMDRNGHSLDIIKIASAYGKDVNLQGFIDNSKILYTNKERIESWLSENRLKLPLPSSSFDSSISSIRTSNQSVKENSDDGTKKFSMREPVEYTKDLVALHNLTADKLSKALALGGFPMPSIAITKADIPHTDFGDITLVFGRETIDPKASKKNTVYSADAWTPTFPQVEFEADRKVSDRIYQKLNDLDAKIDDFFRGDLSRLKYGFEDNLNRYGGEAGLVENAMENYGLKAAYLEENGIHIEKVTKQVEADKGYSTDRISKYLDILEVLGTTNAEEIGKLNLKELREAHGEELENILPGMTKSAIRMSRILRQVMAYINDRTGKPVYEIDTDANATRKVVDDALDMAGFEKWVRELFSGIEGASGVRNQKDLFTPSGNRRSFQQTHYPVTLENIVKAMAAQNGGSTKNVAGFNGVKTLRAGMAERFRSIADIHLREGRLQDLTEAQVEEINNHLSNRLYAVIEAIDQENGEKGSGNSLIRYDEIGEILSKVSGSGKYALADIQSVFQKYGKQVNDDIALDIKNLLYDVSQMPVNIFEAKPERVIRFDEVKAAVLPAGTNGAIVDGLQKNSVPVKFYEPGNDFERLQLVNNMDELKFSTRASDSEKKNRALQKENERLKEDVANLKELLKLQGKTTGGTLFRKDSLKSVANLILRQTDRVLSPEQKTKFATILGDAYSVLANEKVTYEDIEEQCRKAAMWLDENGGVREHLDPYAETVLAEMKGVPIRLDETQKAEARHLFGDLRAFQSRIAGTVKLSSDGVPLDDVWNSLAADHPMYFDKSASSAGLPGMLVEAIDRLRNTKDVEASEPMPLERMMVKVYDGFWKASKQVTVADRYERELAEVIQQYRQSRKRSVDSRQRTEGRHQVQRVVNDLNKLLLRPDKKNHVPIQLQAAVAAALDAVNMDYLDADRRIAELSKRLETTKSQKQRDEINGQIHRLTERGGSMKEKLTDLHNAYVKIMESNDPEISGAYDEVIANLIQETTENIGDTPLREMTKAQLEAVYNMYRAVLVRVRDANKAFAAGQKLRISEISGQVVTELKRKPELPKVQDTKKNGVKQFFWNNEKPIYAFERIGSETLTGLYQNLRKGEDTWVLDVNEAKGYFQMAAKKYGYDKWGLEQSFEFTSTSGKNFRLNLSQIMSLYAYSRREAAADHIRKGGIVIDENTEVKVKGKLGIPKAANVSDATAYNISDDTLAKMFEKLAPEQKAFAEAMQKYLSKTMGAKGNEVSIQLYGIKLFGEENYWPLKSSQKHMPKAKEQNENPNNKLKNAGMTKSTVPHANSPIVLSGFMETWADHVNEMSMYHALVLPMEDFYRVYNWRSGTDEISETESMQAILENRAGKEAVAYIDQFLKDLNGGLRADPRETVSKQMISNFKKAAVFTSASVVVQQPSAIGRAFAYVEPKYFAGRNPSAGMSQQQQWEECKKYAPVAAIKEMGMFDTDMGRSTVDYIMAKEYSGMGEKVKAFALDGSYRDEVLGWAPGKADEITWCAIWTACKRKVAAEQKVTGEAMLKAAGELFTEVITKTQVYDSVFSRSGNMRAETAQMSMLTSFMAEPTTSVNMLEDAMRKIGHGDKKGAAKVVASVAVSSLINSLMAAFVYAARDDDEDKTYLEKYLSNAVSGFLDDINPVTMIPFLRDIWSVLQGYDIERADMSVLSEVLSSVNSLVPLALKDTSEMDQEKLSEYYREWVNQGLRTADGVFSLAGLPEKNIRREINAIINLFQKSNWRDSSANTVWKAIWEDVRSITPILRNAPRDSKSDNLYKAYISGDPVYRKRAESAYDDSQKLDAALKKGLRDNDPRIRKAAEALNAGNSEERIRITREIVSEKNFDQDIVILAISAEAKALQEAPAKDYRREAQSIYTTYDYARAAESGSAEMAEIRADIIRAKVANGKSEEEAESSFDSGVTSTVREMYEDDIFARDQAIAALVHSGIYDRDTAKSSVDKWSCKKDTGIAYQDIEQAFLDNEISSAQAKQMYIRYGGKTNEEAENAIKSAEFVREYPACAGISVSAVSAYNDYCKRTGMDAELFYDAWQFNSKTKADVDGNGKAISGSRKEKVMAYIDGQNLTKAQKDSLYYAFGWAESTINEAPWH